MGLSGTRQLIMIEEMERFGAGRVNDQGLVILSPLLIQNGSDEQKRFFLPRILSGEHVWAQAYSEPAPDRISPRCASPPAITGTIGCSMGKRPGSRWDRTRTGLLCSRAQSVALHEELGRGPVPESLIAGSLAAQALALTNEHRLLERVTAGDTCWRSLGKKCRTDRG
ncbi:acyl-CoA dehydrogenase family protein [Bradyrhizobium ottawaense]|uniref:Acyl-CoA dehydrogenase/oxidase N-terminal domain-containing protein n=1 Tax=Bradyrhizobium ottawaense TaxID=931866 RepID=A0A2U8PH29_9BRAD|nr:hypothetical protein CIT37_35310 [Bradyrhizobium ottawaense]MBR1326058.1 acyl-CoA dehydrogenase family protein [Bradyrhizobium ottawaense]